MTEDTAAGDTWGISGPTFLLALWTATAVTVLATMAYTQFASPKPAPVDPADLAPLQAAYLMGGPLLAVYASLAWLRNGGAVGPVNGGLVKTGPAPAGGTLLDHAVHQAAKRLRLRLRLVSVIPGRLLVIDATARQEVPRRAWTPQLPSSCADHESARGSGDYRAR